MAQPTSGQWNVVQFLETLNFFGEVPFLGSIRWLQQMFDRSAVMSAPSLPEAAKSGNILVAGASTDLGKFFIEVLRQRRYPFQIWPADAAQSASLHASLAKLEPECCNNISAIFVCDNIPAAELIQPLQPLCCLDPFPQVTHRLFDFNQPAAEIQRLWGALDDVVMGGVSTGGLYLGQGVATFAGNVSTANSGGFSSVRTKDFEPPFDLSSWQGIRLLVKGDGQRYKFILRDRQGWDSLAYCQSFDTEAQSESIIYIPFAALRPTFRAKTVNDAAAFNPGSVYSFQVMLSKFEYDQALNPHFKAGAFELQIKNIDVYVHPAQLNLFYLGAQLSDVDSDLADGLPACISYQPIDLSQTSVEAAVDHGLARLEASFAQAGY
ncbi:CIA30 family protein [Almyronema epifaneia]|uniref:CIA30 family protein n=1 Tax=Almyronema epifaneia S1 TaxID=2991925 RepID=A0ABW6IDS9_9CYAN